MNFGKRAIHTIRDIVVPRLSRGQVSNLLSDTNLPLVGLDSQGKISSGSLE